ncbi:MAG: helix-turn-helix transcriptional regulator [Lactobacillaceae bacterium]|jgi:DNA-binding HxlR family transcriptional regulator|nr:helix-turn-helix transcriptional regulator [Lactobacillaceae bacterium]
MNENNCTAAFSILGKKWNGEIINIMLKAKEPIRFSDISGELNACSQKVLTERLKELETTGIIERVSLDNSSRFLYALTESGKAMKELMYSINQWADIHLK